MTCAVSCFRENNHEVMLSASVASFEVSDEFNRVVDYLDYIFSDVCLIFSKDNILQTKLDE